MCEMPLNLSLSPDACLFVHLNEKQAVSGSCKVEHKNDEWGERREEERLLQHFPSFHFSAKN